MTSLEVQARLLRVLDGFEELAVAASGGVDSMTLAWFAHRTLPGRASIYHAMSPAVPAEATARVRAYGERCGWDLHVVDAGELADERYVANPADRCFYCKTDLYGTIRRHTDKPIASGANLDDLGDWRPGLKAAADHEVRHPLIEAGIDKKAVRALATSAGLFDLAELPSSPCLSSRVETGIPISIGALAAIESAERLLRSALDSQTLRCRLRRDGLEVQLDQDSLDRLGGEQRQDLGLQLSAICREHGISDAVRFGPYVRGSAFVRKTA
jgi:pyridinium-3,5-biscarboxylic acid mononucleotide sulfurtransferase